jgi:transposase-like protein
VYAPSRKEAERQPKAFEAWCEKRGYRQAAETLGRHWDRMVTFYQFPQEHWVHLRTVNVVESPFAALRLRTDVAKRFKRCDGATWGIWKSSGASVALLISIMPTHLLTEPP